ncbi:MAG: NYN domain-containing protein [Thermodesulfovibrionales bacterium]
MSHIIIDGYNCIGVIHKDLQKARLDFINMLIDYRQTKPHSITVVFDGHKDGGYKETHIRQGGIRIIYTPIGISADDTILRVISEERYHWLVVSDDKTISKGAWAMGMIAIPSSLFLKSIHRSLGDYEEEDVYIDKRQKLSKQQRAIKRALSHL